MTKFAFKSLFAASVFALVASASAFAADTYKLDANHTSVTFQYTHFGFSHPTGKFMNAVGSVTLDDATPANSSVEVSFDINGINTGVAALDTHLKSADFFDAAKFPTATFKSTQVELTGENTANVTGDLTVHGITQSTVLAVTFNKKAFNPALFKTGYGFSATAHLSRKAFGLGNLEPIVGDDIDLIIDAEVY